MSNPEDVAPATETSSVGVSDLRAQRRGFDKYAPAEPQVEDIDPSHVEQPEDNES